MLGRFQQQNPLDSLKPVADKDQILAARQAVKTVKVSDAVRGYVVDLARASREFQGVRLGMSPRGALALMRGAQVRAAFAGPVVPQVPASILQMHPNFILVGDKAALSKLG